MAKKLKHINPAGDTPTRFTQAAKIVKKHSPILKAIKQETRPEEIWKFKMVKARDLWLNPRAQRDSEIDEIEDFSLNWKHIFATPLIGVYRTDLKQMRVADGQQHGLSDLIKHGSDIELPVCYIETDSEEVELDVFMGINDGRRKVELADAHKIYVNRGIDYYVKLDNAVTKADCFIHRTSNAPGAITHYAHLKKCNDIFGTRSVQYVLSRIRAWWPDEKVEGVFLFGLLIVFHRGQLGDNKAVKRRRKYVRSTFEDILESCADRFTQKELVAASKRVFNDSDIMLKSGKSKTSHPELVASGIISVHNIVTGKNCCPALYNDLDMPIMKAEFDLHPDFDKNTYGTRPLYEDACDTGDVRPSWAYFEARAHGLDYEELLEKCTTHCDCCGVEFDYGRGFNNDGKTDENTPSVHHIIAKANGGTNEVRVLCNRTNRILSDGKASDSGRFIWAAENVEKDRDLETA